MILCLDFSYINHLGIPKYKKFRYVAFIQGIFLRDDISYMTYHTIIAIRTRWYVNFHSPYSKKSQSDYAMVIPLEILRPLVQ